mmetsp:Transcript_87128/g.255009  ORF Transcript_87128/g.255009 Transcript_87128/m.255009 type:complete len:303 (-) Transcript_87128:275-1183(-)
MHRSPGRDTATALWLQGTSTMSSSVPDVRLPPETGTGPSGPLSWRFRHFGLVVRLPQVGVAQSERHKCAEVFALKPLEVVLLDVTQGAAHFAEHLPQALVVRPLLELQAPGLSQVVLEGVREARTELIERRRLLLLADLPVLLLLRLRQEARPGQGAADEVEEHVADSLEVVAPALLQAPVRVDGRVARRAREAELGPQLGVAVHEVALAEAKVDDVEVVHLVVDPKHEVLGLDVPVNDALGVKVLDAAQQLVRDQHRGLYIEAAVAAVLHSILEGLAEQLHHHAVVPPFLPMIEALGNALG